MGRRSELCQMADFGISGSETSNSSFTNDVIRKIYHYDQQASWKRKQVSRTTTPVRRNYEGMHVPRNVII